VSAGVDSEIAAGVIWLAVYTSVVVFSAPPVPQLFVPS